MTGPSSTLKDEHEAIRALLGALEGVIERIRTEDDIPKDDLYDAVAVVAEFADQCHQGKEEMILFPAMLKASPEAEALVKRLSDDHVVFRGHVRLIKELLPRAQTKAIRKRIAGHLSTYVRLHREHMRLVDEELLPAVDRLLPPEERARIDKDFAALEKKEIGWGMKDAYRAIIRRLAETYA